MSLGHSYEDEDMEQILKRALEIDGLPGNSRRSLELAADELGISPEALEQAEAEHRREKQELRERREFAQHQRRATWSDITTFMTVNSVLILINLVTHRRLSWSLIVLAIWGIILLLEVGSKLNTRSAEYQREFEKWRAKKARRSLSNE